MMRRFGVAAVLALLAGTLPAATYTVTNTDDSGAGSLRQALTDANGNAGADTIEFNVTGAGCDGSGVCTIAPVLPLPNVTDPVTIDGYTQPGASPNTIAQGATDAVLKIVLSGVNLPFSWGLYATSDDVTIRGLVVNGFGFGVGSNSSDNVSFRGCFIGVDASGSAAVPNDIGLFAYLGTGIVVGGPAPADRNLISGNISNGAKLERCTDGLVQGNLIGTDASGAASIGSGSVGLRIGVDSPGTAVRENVVAAAGSYGIHVGQMGSDTVFGMTIQGNWVGTDVTGTAELGNLRDGILVDTNQVTIGGLGAGEGNVIAFNLGAGVLVAYDTPQPRQNPIRGNAIYSNGIGDGAGNFSTLGIDLGDPGTSGQGGPTANDQGDGDAGPNDHQNYPLIASAVTALPTGTPSTTIQGTLDSVPSTQFAIDFYADAACLRRPQGFREGQSYIGTDTVTTDGNGHAVINTVLPIALGPGDRVTATATDPSNNTSEFSQRFVLSSNPASGSPAGGIVTTLTGFHFFAGASATVGGLPASNVDVNGYTSMDVTTPALPPGTVNSITVTNTDGSASTLTNGWVADFLDVPGAQQFYFFVTALVRNQITAGVGGGNYGVNAPTLRQQMAVFLLKGKFGVCYVPPQCTGVFGDVPCPSTFANWIEALAAEGITGGCGTGIYCPQNPVRRDQMAVFLLKAKHGSAYAPPGCTGTFDDVPCPSGFADWIEQLAAEQITGGCGGNNYCPSSNNTRGQMAVFIVKTFSSSVKSNRGSASGGRLTVKKFGSQ